MKVTFNNPDFPDGHEFFLGGIVLLPNGKSVEVSDEDAARYEAAHGEKFSDVIKKNPLITAGSAKGGE